MKPCIIVHGGASNIADIFVERSKSGTQVAAKAGYTVLKGSRQIMGHVRAFYQNYRLLVLRGMKLTFLNARFQKACYFAHHILFCIPAAGLNISSHCKGGSALDAVCAAVTSLEDNPAFDAGHGSCLTEEGTVEMDAFIMDGETLRVGAVGAVTDIANPVQLSKKILENTPHCMLVGQGASKFAKKVGHPVLSDPTELIVEESVLKAKLDARVKFHHNVKTYFNNIIHSKDMQELEEIASKMARAEDIDPKNGSVGHDTVGAVAIDENGRIACATSTGGIPGKWVGRVGDTPLTGCGGYANRFGGASSTGHGESITKTTICRQAVYYMENGDDAQTAAEKAIKYLGNETDGRGGIICISNKGDIGFSFSTFRMGWAFIADDKIKFGIDHGDKFEASLN